jgi:hypothetical protein
VFYQCLLQGKSGIIRIYNNFAHFVRVIGLLS